VGVARLGRALLGSGLLGATLLGGAGGYGLGLLTSEQATAGTSAAPLAADTSARPVSSTPTPPAKTPVPDNTEPLRADDIEYKTRSFTVRGVLQSAVSVRVPRYWEFSIPAEQKYVRFNEPARKRWIRIEAGFTIQRPPAAAMAARIALLKDVPADQMFTIKSQYVDPKTQDATLVYTYVPEQTVRYVIVRWVANPAGLCHFELAVIGLPQDKAALADILDHATESAVRTDSPIN
jgi:hypothetical protein